MSAQVYNEDGLTKLLMLALQRYNKGSVLCKYLYRNKSSTYFENIINNNNFVMEPYVKDAGADKYNPLNRRVHGLFFFASVAEGSRTGAPQPFSYFGNTRFLVPIELLVDRSEMNLYFADYFCLGTRCDFHYVTLVVTQKNNVVDEFCQYVQFPKLSWENNPFFFYDSTSETYKVHNSHDHLVEIFYTEPINIAEKLQNGAKLIHYMETRGPGSSKPLGKPKNMNCTQCNIYPKSALHCYVCSKSFSESYVNRVNFQSLPVKLDIPFKFGYRMNEEYHFNTNPPPGKHYLSPRTSEAALSKGFLSSQLWSNYGF